MNPSHVFIYITLYRQIALIAVVLDPRPTKLYYKRGQAPGSGKMGELGRRWKRGGAGELIYLVSIEEKRRMEM